MECVACFDLITLHRYGEASDLKPLRWQGHELFIKLQAMRRDGKILGARVPEEGSQPDLGDAGLSQPTRFRSAP